MPIILHKFRDHEIHPDTETLILGTFNPDIPGGPDFFYGRPRNFLWHLLPKCWGLESLKDAPLRQKKEFMSRYKIDFVDLIHSVDVPAGEEGNVDDAFIDSRVVEWKDMKAVIDSLPHLKAVYLTRKTLNGLQFMRPQIALIADYCATRNIRFCKLETPARFFSDAKQRQWIDTIVLQNTCLRV